MSEFEGGNIFEDDEDQFLLNLDESSFTSVIVPPTSVTSIPIPEQTANIIQENISAETVSTQKKKILFGPNAGEDVVERVLTPFEKKKLIESTESFKRKQYWKEKEEKKDDTIKRLRYQVVDLHRQVVAKNPSPLWSKNLYQASSSLASQAYSSEQDHSEGGIILDNIELQDRSIDIQFEKTNLMEKMKHVVYLERKIVTYKYLVQNFGLSLEKAEKFFAWFGQKEKNVKIGVRYYVYGTKISSSSYEKVYFITICDANELESLKCNRLVEILLQFIYCLGLDIPEDKKEFYKLIYGLKNFDDIYSTEVKAVPVERKSSSIIPDLKSTKGTNVILMPSSKKKVVKRKKASVQTNTLDSFLQQSIPKASVENQEIQDQDVNIETQNSDEIFANFDLDQYQNE